MANFYVIGGGVEGPKLKNSPVDNGIRYSVSFGINARLKRREARSLGRQWRLSYDRR